jgi:hypothetical protein
MAMLDTQVVTIPRRIVIFAAGGTINHRQLPSNALHAVCHYVTLQQQV